MQDDQNPPEQSADYAGYRTVDDLVRGYRNSSEEGKRQRERADELEASNQALAAALTEAVARSRQAEMPRQAVPQRAPRLIPADELEAHGIPTDALDRFVDHRVNQKLEPIARGLHARTAFVAKHPDYVAFEQGVSDYIMSDPQMRESYPKLFAADPVSAMELAFMKFAEQHRAAMPHTNGNGAREGIGDAVIPGTRAGDSRRGHDLTDEIRTAFEQWQKTGSSADAQKFVKLRLKTVISDEFLNQ